MVSLQYSALFHNVVASGGYRSRILIYSINLNDNPIDVQSRPEVEQYATLLKYNNSDTDSNGRIGEGGIKINNYFNKSEQIEIGDAVCCNIELSLINDDGYFSTYDWKETIIIYWEVWEEQNQMWLWCPLGIYWWERPTKTNTLIIQAKANDAMSLLENWASVAFPSPSDPDWENGIPLYQFYNNVVGNIAGVVPDPGIQYVPNMTVLYYREPFDATNMTRKEVLAWMAGVCGGIAQISRDGTPRIRFFKDAYWQDYPQGPKYYYTLDGDAGPSPIMDLDIGEYTVPQIDRVDAMVGQINSTFTAGSGANTLYSINNGFLAKGGISAQYMVNKIYDVVTGADASSDITAYTPIAVNAYFDPSVEAGDIIRVVRDGVTYKMPVFQQILYWNGADWTAELQNSGYENRRIPSEAERSAYTDMSERTDSDLTSASIDSSGVMSFENAAGNTKFTVQLPLYNGGVS